MRIAIGDEMSLIEDEHPHNDRKEAREARAQSRRSSRRPHALLSQATRSLALMLGQTPCNFVEQQNARVVAKALASSSRLRLSNVSRPAASLAWAARPAARGFRRYGGALCVAGHWWRSSRRPRGSRTPSSRRKLRHSERSRDPQLASTLWRQMRNVMAFVFDPSAVKRQSARDQSENGVVLPAPLGPRMPTASPCSTKRSSSLCDDYRAERFDTLRSARTTDMRCWSPPRIHRRGAAGAGPPRTLQLRTSAQSRAVSDRLNLPTVAMLG